ncbi:MAG: Asp-tRNA(Asn)/Glu-tRNA(Gln) amidotransferase subunit GatB, partial [Candidatus Sungiibacteriota bacterium]
YAADAAAYEIKRQTALLEAGEKIVQETRGWNDHTQETFAQRSKEDAHDYRYFPEPDLPPLRLAPEFIDEIRRAVPELPAAKRERFAREYWLASDMIETLVRDRAMADYFETAASEAQQHDKETPEKPRVNLARAVAALITGDLLRLLHETSSPIADIRISSENLAELAVLAAEEKVSSTAAKQILAEMFSSGDGPSDIAERLGLWQISGTTDLEDIARHIITENPKAVEDYRKGKMASVQFLVGQMMKQSRGTANPKIAQEIIARILNQES